MKKLSLLLAGMLSSLTSLAWNYQPNPDFYYTYRGSRLGYRIVESKTCEVCCKDEVSENLSIPSIVSSPSGKEYSVTSIDQDVFIGCNDLISIDLPNTMRGIGHSAFRGCRSLTSIQIPSSMWSIRDEAFRSCTGLTEVIITDSDDSLDGYDIPLSFGENVFYEAPITKLYIGRNFNYNNQYPPFCNKGSLTEITISNSVTSIRPKAFSGCFRLKEVTIADGEKPLYISDGVFSEDDELTKLYVGRNLSYSDYYSPFYKKSSLTELIIGNTVTSIGSCAFSDCSGLTSVEIPNSVTSIGSRAFSGCSGLTSVEIPNSVTSIGSGAFLYCRGLTSVEIPNFVTSIGAEAFSGCSGLTSVEIPNSVTSIGSGAFLYCRGLTSVEIPNFVTSIGAEAFYGCNGLNSVYYNSVDPIEAKSNIFLDLYGNIIYDQATLYVPAESVEKCKRIDPWKNFQNVQAFDFSSKIQEISENIDVSLPYEVFTLGGNKVSGDLDSLSPGIYIIRQGNTVKKIAVK